MQSSTVYLYCKSFKPFMYGDPPFVSVCVRARVCIAYVRVRVRVGVSVRVSVRVCGYDRDIGKLAFLPSRSVEINFAPGKITFSPALCGASILTISKDSYCNMVFFYYLAPTTHSP